MFFTKSQTKTPIKIQTTVSLLKKIGKELNYSLVRGDAVRPGYDRRYALADKNLKSSGFSAPFDFDATLDRIISWYADNGHWLWVD